MHAERSVVRWDAARAEKHLVKLRRVASKALQQSRQVWLPTIEGPVSAADV
jgi:16S rRNA U1498 N3-methylase RsmE